MRDQSYRAAGIMSRKHSVKRDNTIVVRKAYAAEKGGVKIRLIRRVAVAVRNNTRVNPSGVAMPCLQIDLGNGLASVDVNDLDVKGERYPLLVLGHVLADKFTGNPVGALGHLRREDTAVVARKKNRWIRIGSDTGKVGLVVSRKNSINIASLEIGFRCVKD